MLFKNKINPGAFCNWIVAVNLLCLVLQTGCKNYQLGNPTELSFDSIYIKPVTNDSFAPQAQAILSTQVRKIFIRESRAKLVSKEDKADVILFINLTDYDKRSAARQANDTTLARSFDLTLYAQISLFNNNKNTYLFKNRNIEQTTNAYLDNPYATTQTQSIIQAEYQTMASLTRDLARKIANEVLSPWEPQLY